VARTGPIATRVEELLDVAVVATTPVAGGDICTATRVRMSTGAMALVKTRPRAPEDFFPREAAGLRWLAEAADGVAVPEVLAAEHDCLVLTWVETARPTVETADELGRALAATHRSGAETFGSPTGADGYIGTLPLPNRPADTWPEFFAVRRILPYLKLAQDRSSIEADDAAAVEGVVRRIGELAGPPEPPARLHGDLWSGNVLWGQDHRAWLVDPAAYAGHRETDLAMMALFGLPQLTRVLDAYQEVAPLADGWEDRVALHQLFPLLVHACLFGGGYGRRAGDAARSLL
jgi:fructosamine-3-kinase